MLMTAMVSRYRHIVRLCALALLGAGAMLVAAASETRADGADTCQDALFFSAARLNIVLAQYEPAADVGGGFDQATYEAARKNEALAWNTADRFMWIVKQDMFLNAGFNGFSVVRLYDQVDGRQELSCSSSKILATILKKHRPASGKAIVFLTGNIYQEDKAIFFRSRLRPGRVVNRQFEEKDYVSLNAAPAGAAARVFSVPVMDGEIVFAPRAISATDMKAIEDNFRESTLSYPEKGGGKPLVIREGPEKVSDADPRVYIIDQVDPDGWMRFRIRGQTRWLRSDPAKGRQLRQTFPELLFLRGMSAYLIARSAATPPEAAAHLRRAVDDAFNAYLELSRDKDPAAQRSAALVMQGAAAVTIGTPTAESWVAAKSRFLEAIKLDPGNVAARNAAAIADIAACCTGGKAPDTVVALRIAGQFLDILARRPTDRHALANLQTFFELLNSNAPAQSYADQRDKVKAVRQMLGYCKAPAC